VNKLKIELGQLQSALFIPLWEMTKEIQMDYIFLLGLILFISVLLYLFNAIFGNDKQSIFLNIA